MNKKLEVVTLNDLNARLASAKAHKQTCDAQVSAAKQTYYANKDEPNRQAMSEAHLSYIAASGQVRKAEEAIRIFVFQRKSVSKNGHLIRL